MVHHPKILFLDEPTLGLDPQTREHIWNYIMELSKRENITMVQTTRYKEGTRVDSFLMHMQVRKCQA